MDSRRETRLKEEIEKFHLRFKFGRKGEREKGRRRFHVSNGVNISLVSVKKRVELFQF